MIIKDDKEILLAYLEDNSGISDGHAEKVYIPESEEECKALIKELYEKGVPVTFSGAGTGMTGGRIPMEGVILSNEKLKKMEFFSGDEGSFVKVQSGVTLEEMKAFLKEKGYFFPVNPTEESASAGAASANNSSGSWTYRYGSMRENIVEADFITHDGIKINMTPNSPLFQGDSCVLKEVSEAPLIRPQYTMPKVKNAAGFYSKKNMSLLDLVIGSEGTLGFLSSVVLKVLPLPLKVIECILFFKEEADAVLFVKKTRALRNTQNLLDPRALEFFNSNALSFLREHHPHTPLAAQAGVIFEQEVFEVQKEDAMLESLLELSDECRALTDQTWMADTPQRLEELRLFRHSLPSIVNERFKRKEFLKLSTDSAVPDDRLSDLLEFYNTELEASGLTSLIFGHIGNNHFHVNILAKPEEVEKAKALYLKFMEKAVSLGGTISAEHGVGKLKKKYLPLLYGNKGLEEMKRVKRYFDPKNLFNRGNVLDS